MGVGGIKSQVSTSNENTLHLQDQNKTPRREREATQQEMLENSEKNLNRAKSRTTPISTKIDLSEIRTSQRNYKVLGASLIIGGVLVAAVCSLAIAAMVNQNLGKSITDLGSGGQSLINFLNNNTVVVQIVSGAGIALGVGMVGLGIASIRWATHGLPANRKTLEIIEEEKRTAIGNTQDAIIASHRAEMERISRTISDLSRSHEAIKALAIETLQDAERNQQNILKANHELKYDKDGIEKISTEVQEALCESYEDLLSVYATQIAQLQSMLKRLTHEETKIAKDMNR